jgi:hypothetical protein
MTACYYSIYCDLIHNRDATTQNVGSNVQNVQERGGCIGGPVTGSNVYTNSSSINFLVVILKICKYVLWPYKLKSNYLEAENVLWRW